MAQTAEATETEHASLRERLLSASALASRVLVEATDLMTAMPTVLRELGEAADVDRTALAIVETDAEGKRWLMVKSEWVAECVVGERSRTVRVAWEDRRQSCCMQLRNGRSVHLTHSETDSARRASFAISAAKSSILVPFLIDGEYAGAIGFDDCRRVREFDPAVISALEIAASVIGAALHRERLIEVVRHERELAAEQRVAELAKANTALRLNLEWLASASDPKRFFDHVLLQIVRQFSAHGGCILMRREDDSDWHVVANVRAGEIEEPSLPASAAEMAQAFRHLEQLGREPVHLPVDELAERCGTPIHGYHLREGHRSVYLLPLVFGERNLGFLNLAFTHVQPLSSAQAELLVALGQQITLAMAFKRLLHSSKQAAVLAERNRIGQEIHDGLAQAFVGILMQLGAAEARLEGTSAAALCARIQDLARDGLAEARRSVLALRPSDSRPGGLEFALRQLADRSTIVGRLRCLFEGGGEATRLAPEHEHELLRIAQEAVSNAVRHARASTVRIVLTLTEPQLLLQIIDDGCGLHGVREDNESPDLSAQQGFGLSNMRERAQVIGAQWLLDSEPGRGTQISVRVARPQAA